MKIMIPFLMAALPAASLAFLFVSFGKVIVMFYYKRM